MLTDRAQYTTGQHRSPAVLSRRAFLGGAAALGAAAALPARPAVGRTSGGRHHRGGFRVSLSVSPFTEAVLASLALADGHETARTVKAVQRLFDRHGATEVYARVATRQHARLGDAEYGWARALERARLARDLGLPLNPELGLWAVYGDITRQPAPDFSDYYLRDLVTQSVESRAVSGIRPWGPDYCLSSGGWAPMSLFNQTGVAKPALTAIQDALRASRMRSSDARQ